MTVAFWFWLTMLMLSLLWLFCVAKGFQALRELEKALKARRSKPAREPGTSATGEGEG